MAAPPASLDRSRPACETDRGWKGSRWRRPAQLATQREDTPTGHERDWDYCRRRRTRRTQDEKLARTAVASERDGCWQRPVARLAVDVDLLGHRGIAVAIAIVIAIAIARRRWSLVWSCVSGLELASSASLNVVPTPGAKSFAARGPGLRPLRQGSS